MQQQLTPQHYGNSHVISRRSATITKPKPVLYCCLTIVLQTYANYLRFNENLLLHLILCSLGTHLLWSPLIIAFWAFYYTHKNTPCHWLCWVSVHADLLISLFRSYFRCCTSGAPLVCWWNMKTCFHTMATLKILLARMPIGHLMIHHIISHTHLIYLSLMKRKDEPKHA